MSDETLQELQDTLDELKDLWQQGETVEMPGPIERARALARDLESEDSDASVEYGHQGTVSAHELIEYESVLERVREHATERFSPLPNGTDVAPDEWEIEHCVIEDCIVFYRVTHPDSAIKSEVEEFAV